jgi:protein SCO1/2
MHSWSGTARGQALAPLLAVLVTIASPALAQDASKDAPGDLPVQARGVDVEEHVGQTLPLELTFTNSAGKAVRLGDYFKNGKPTIMALVYYKCPVACQVVMQRMAETINQLDYTVGKDYNALIFSFDPTETSRDARQAKIGFVSGYSKEVTPEVEAGWEFHTCTEESARALGENLGFKFRKLDTGVYSHPVALFIITPDGRISRYLYGFAYPARDVKLALMEASEGKLVRSIGERLTFYCFLYDKDAGKYTLQIHRVMQIAGVATAAGLGMLIGGFVIGERIRRRRAQEPKAAAADVITLPHTTGGQTT